MLIPVLGLIPVMWLIFALTGNVTALIIAVVLTSVLAAAVALALRATARQQN